MKAFEVIFCIVNKGFADRAMDAARAAGAKGGTILHGRGTASPDAEKLFGITIQPDKDVVLLLVPAKIKDDVLHAIYKSAGLKSAGQGIAFSLPVSRAVGLREETEMPKDEKTE